MHANCAHKSLSATHNPRHRRITSPCWCSARTTAEDDDAIAEPHDNTIGQHISSVGQTGRQWKNLQSHTPTWVQSSSCWTHNNNCHSYHFSTVFVGGPKLFWNTRNHQLNHCTSALQKHCLWFRPVNCLIALYLSHLFKTHAKPVWLRVSGSRWTLEVQCLVEWNMFCIWYWREKRRKKGFISGDWFMISK